MNQAEFEPHLLGFLCTWCAYAGADLAGVSRLHYPANLRVIRVKCSGRVDPAFVVDGFLAGMDGVLVGGCHPGECHYIRGNCEAMNTINITKLLLKHIKVDPRRLRLCWVSASEGVRFSRVVQEFTDDVRKLGPLGQGEAEDKTKLTLELRAARAVAGRQKMRWLLGQVTPLTEKGNHYGERFTYHELERMFSGVISDELETSRILLLLEKGPASTVEIAVGVQLSPDRVLRRLRFLIRRGAIRAEITGEAQPLFSTALAGAGAR